MKSTKGMNTAIKLYRFVLAKTGGDAGAVDEVLYNLAQVWLHRRRPADGVTNELTELLVRLARFQRVPGPRLAARPEALPRATLHG